MKGKTKMWDVFPDDMGLDSSTKSTLANLDLNDQTSAKANDI